jgi:superfamily II DNA or RNA helicase
MKFRVVEGKNFKNFVVMTEIITKQDFEYYEIVKKVLFRSEYKPFIQGFNKTINYSYLFNDYFFPTTFWYDVKKQLDKFDKSIAILENEEFLYNNIDREYFDQWIASCKFPDDIKTNAEEYMFQQDSVFHALNFKIGKIDVSMSAGKTFISYLYCRFLIEHILEDQDNQKILIVVPNKGLCIQLKNEWAHYDKFFERHITVETIFSGSKKLIGADVICGTFQSLANYDEEYFLDFKVFLCDELHRAKSYSIRNEIFAKLINCEYFFGMTGSMWEYKTLDYLHITSMFGPTLVLITTDDLIQSGVACPLKIHGIRINYIKDANFSKNLKENGIVGIEKYRLEKKFFQTYEARTNLMVKLMTKGYFGNSLILVDTIAYVMYLQDFLSEYCQDWQYHVIHKDIKNREEIVDLMKITPDHFGLIGTYQCVGTGISIKNIENIYFPDGGKSLNRIKQGYGRGLRLFPNKLWCNVFDFQDQMEGSSFKDHARERNKIYLAQKLPVKFIDISI